MSDRTRRLLLRLAQSIFIVAVFVYGGRKIADAWSDATAHGGADLLGRLSWSRLLAATGVVLLTYLLLIQLWRYVLRSWGERLHLTDAMAIWSISSLGRYVPGRVAQLVAMMLMASRRGISPTAATGSALLNVLLNIGAGVVVALVLGGRALDSVRPGAATLAIVAVALGIVGMLLLPWLLPRMVRLAARLLRRDIAEPRMGAAAVWITAAGNVVAWLLYGVAFHMFATGVLGDAAAGATSAYIAVYTGSYVVGYLVLFTPGGLGVREATMATMLVALGLCSMPQAWLLAFASRVWLLAVEVLPGIFFLAHGFLRRPTKLTPGDASP